ncbi:long-chain acyl-CoA thioesterase, BFIT_BACH family [Syntrophotalea carbinolica DSM 2380]|uniref:Long-chain acyl-CoA thioesterase, BFIT_BACH family n=1 Tax=Syntrophotalea carbinolica (strain DSM 2380 / NBRC 103641 / GraBd1) TaxID=338963 RepID=Q3A1K3_SYNC1|nr:acyl-CoA thioesterase [Syntrophotalea carbinolica]ABA89754.1 long-chain acyl-CoA thioesterase, BFIT_BACH family [Syntrophotalea carbinolica DSM 2380]
MPNQVKTVSQTRVVLAQVAMPGDANPAGNVHGGTIMKLIDNAAGVVAMRHTRRNVVTASIDRLDFHYPVFVGNLIILKACLNRVGKTSMEVGVRVEAENVMTGEIRHTASAYLTFVALDADGYPTNVPELISETLEDKRRLAEAVERYERRRCTNCRR